MTSSSETDRRRPAALDSTTRHDPNPPPRHRDPWWLTVIVYTALLVRVYPAYDNVFAEGRVVFQGMDAWYHMRLIDNLVHNFPLRTTFDPYAIFPAGQEVAVPPFLDLAVALVAWVAGLGSPSERLVEVVAAWFPAVLGALTVVPVYFIGRRIFDRRAGLLAAGLLAVQPGQFLLRSVLGFVDHHVAETFLSSLTVWLLLLSLDRASSETGWSAWNASAAAGLTLGAYLLNWGGGSLFVAVLVAWMTVQHVLDHLHGRSSGYLGWKVALPMAAAAFVALVPFLRILPRAAIHSVALTLLAATPFLMTGLSRLLIRAGIPRYLYPVAVLAGGLAGAFLLRWAMPDVAARIVANAGRFLPHSAAGTVGEAMPLLTGEGLFLEAVWEQYRTAFFLGLAGLGILVYRLARQGAGNTDTLLLVWSLAMFSATLGQNRFGYYLDVNVCLLIGMLCHLILGARRTGIGHSIPRALAAVLVALVAFVPTFRPVIEVARLNRGPDAAWFDALHWLRGQTVEPFGDPAAYLKRFPRPPRGERFPYPREAYSVMTWWDYGYWITRIGRRIPSANPTQSGAVDAARFFLSTDARAAQRILKEAGARYVLVHSDLGAWPDPDTGHRYGFFEAMATWAGEDPSRFYEVVVQPTRDGALEPIFVFYPDFYRTMVMRLYLFEGDEVLSSDATWAVAIEEDEDHFGTPTQVIVDSHAFASYEEAAAFLATRPGDRWRLIGRDPLHPCIPLESLRGLLRQVHRSPPPDPLAPRPPAIRIFEVGAGLFVRDTVGGLRLGPDLTLQQDEAEVGAVGLRDAVASHATSHVEHTAIERGIPVGVER